MVSSGLMRKRERRSTLETESKFLDSSWYWGTLDKLALYKNIVDADVRTGELSKFYSLIFLSFTTGRTSFCTLCKNTAKPCAKANVQSHNVGAFPSTWSVLLPSARGSRPVGENWGKAEWRGPGKRCKRGCCGILLCFGVLNPKCLQQFSGGKWFKNLQVKLLRFYVLMFFVSKFSFNYSLNTT